jgi:rod shape-determining protein MreD
VTWWRRGGVAAAYGLLLLLAVAVEGAWAWRLGWGGGAADPVLLLVLAASLRRGPEVGALAGFAGGLLQDLAGGGPLGMVALSKSVVGLAAGTLARTLALEGAWAPAALAAAASVGAKLVELGLAWLAGDAPLWLPWLAGTAATASYNALLAPIVFAGLRRVRRWLGPATPGGVPEA